jgi:hypothetical protein
MPVLLASLMLASSALAQTTLSQASDDQQTDAEKDFPSNDAISAARSQYAQNGKAESVRVTQSIT